MRPEPRPPMHPRDASGDPGKEARMLTFRRHLRDTDKFMLEGRFDKAWLKLAEAAKLEPNHPMLIAFKERLELAQQKLASLAPAPTDTPPEQPAQQADTGLSVCGDVPVSDKTQDAPVHPSAQVDAQPPGSGIDSGLQEAIQKLTEAGSELETLRKALEAECQKGVRLEKDISTLQEKHNAEAAQAEERHTREVEAALEAERKRLEGETVKLLEKQKQELRAQFQNEFDQKITQETERLRGEFDRKLELLGINFSQSNDQRLTRYREKVRQYYANGKPSPEEEQKLDELRKLMQVTPEEHLTAASEVRLALYVEHVEQGSKSGALSTNLAAALEELKKRFAITPEESIKLEPYILATFQQLAVKGRILLVDDDQMVLTSVGRVLTDYGFQVVPVESIQTAMEKLRSMPIDFIVSDIRFASGELEGFKFFEMVAEQPNLRDIPFVFMSALQDSFIVRSGAKLGADDYLLKPVEPDLLIAIIEGKMKRYHHSRSRTTPTQAN